MAGLEAEPLVEAVGVAAALVREQLDEAAAAPVAFRDRPFEHRSPDAATAPGAGDPHGFDLPAPGAAAGDAGDESDLHATDHHAVLLRHYQPLVGVAFDRREGLEIPLIERQAGVIPRLAELVVGNHCDDGRQVGGGCSSE